MLKPDECCQGDCGDERCQYTPRVMVGKVYRFRPGETPVLQCPQCGLQGDAFAVFAPYAGKHVIVEAPANLTDFWQCNDCGTEFKDAGRSQPDWMVRFVDGTQVVDERGIQHRFFFAYDCELHPSPRSRAAT